MQVPRNVDSAHLWGQMLRENILHSRFLSLESLNTLQGPLPELSQLYGPRGQCSPHTCKAWTSWVTSVSFWPWHSWKTSPSWGTWLAIGSVSHDSFLTICSTRTGKAWGPKKGRPFFTSKTWIAHVTTKACWKKWFKLFKLLNVQIQNQYTWKSTTLTKTHFKKKYRSIN